MKSVTAPAVVREISLPVEELLRALLGMDAARRVSILDSCGSRPPDARFLIAGFDPTETVEARGHELRISRAGETRVLRSDVLALLDERLEAYRVARNASLPVAGACIASLSYDLARQFERLRSSPPPASAEEPDAVL